jgi:hypothetical protein
VRSFYQRLIFEVRKKSNCLAFHKWFLGTFWQQKVSDEMKNGREWNEDKQMEF